MLVLFKSGKDQTDLIKMRATVVSDFAVSVQPS